MRIQVVSNNNLTFQTNYEIVHSTLNAPKTLDLFDVNIFSLQNENMWKCNENTNQRINQSNDLYSIRQMIETSQKATNIIALPQNYMHYYNYWEYEKQYYYNIELKDEIPNLIKNLLSSIIPEKITSLFNLIYENSETPLNGATFKSAFCFIRASNVLTRSNGGNKATTIKFNNLILTTIDLQSPNTKLEDYIKGIGLDNQKIEIPQWLIDYKCFDDVQQQNLIDESNQEIDRLKGKIKQANAKLNENLKYKSILCTNGDDLVTVIFEILEQTLDCALSDFVDEGKQDFLIKKENVTFIGEIKGITSNVKSENVSQLDVHYQSYMDDLQEKGITENVKPLLIINPFRTKPIAERDEVHENQINLAKRNASLIITTETLLNIFEKFLNAEISSEKIISFLNSKTGLLTEEAFYEDKEKVDNSVYKM